MSSKENLDQAALDNLTPEEREAFEDSEYSQHEKSALQRLAAGAEDDDGDDDEVLDADGNPVVVADPPVAVTEVVTPPVVETPPAKAEPAEIQPKVVVQPASYQAELPADFEERVKSLAERTAELRASFKGGDIDFDTFEAKNAELADEREKLTLARAKVEISQEMTQQNAAAMWTNSINSFYASVKKAEGIDYRADEGRQSDLDQFVKALANKPENQDKGMEWFLHEAHKRVNSLHGVATPAAAATPAPTPVKPVPRTPPPAPKGISQIPGGDGPGDVGSEFAHLDALDGDELEMAIARMSPTQREKFSRGQ